MKIIAGIGNPGARYEFTRHNAGFIFLDFLAREFSLNYKSAKFSSEIAEGSFSGQSFVLIKPQTYVNLSGNAIGGYLRYFKYPVEDLLVVYDDINIEPGKYKVNFGGSDGGHNGIYSIINVLSDDKFSRLRIGIGNNFEKGLMPDYVLSKFPAAEWDLTEANFPKFLELSKGFLKSGSKGFLDANSKLTLNQKNTEKDK